MESRQRLRASAVPQPARRRFERLTLTYNETRTNCIPLDSTLFATVDWPSLRIWATPAGGARRFIGFRSYLTPRPSRAAINARTRTSRYRERLCGGDYVGLAFLPEAYTYQLFGADTLTDAVTGDRGIASMPFHAAEGDLNGTTIRVYYTGGGPDRGPARRVRTEIASASTVIRRARRAGTRRQRRSRTELRQPVESDARFQLAAGNITPDPERPTLHDSHE